MGHQKSQQTSRNASSSEHTRRPTGTLFVVGTPIGCPDDLTLRARTILTRVSIVAAETPLVTRTLLDSHGIGATVTGYGQGDEEKIAILLDRLAAGHDIALVSDSGMPVIYDPGRRLVAAARAAGYQVTVIPGPSALTAAAAISGESADRLFRELRREIGTTVMFAPTSAVPRILERMRRILPDRKLTLTLDMTKDDERVHQGDARALLQQVRSFSKDSEVTLVLSGARKGWK